MSSRIEKLTGSVNGLIKKYENLGYRAKKKIYFIISRIFLYFVLLEMAYLFILPFIYIFCTSLMTSSDYLDPTDSIYSHNHRMENFSKRLKLLTILNRFSIRWERLF